MRYGFELVVLGCYCGPSWWIADFRGFVECVLVSGVVGRFGVSGLGMWFVGRF